MNLIVDKFGNAGLEDIATELIENSHILLEELNFSVSDMNANTQSLRELIKANRIIKLDLSYNDLSGSALEYISIGLLDATQLKKLHLSGGGIHRSEIHLEIQGRTFTSNTELFFWALGRNSNLQELDLNANHLDNEDMTMLANSLKRNRSLKKLMIPMNEIFSEGIHFLAEGLKQNHGLEYLDPGVIGPDDRKFLQDARGLDEQGKYRLFVPTF